jgi:histidinol-phosphate aminotransferase
MVDLIDDKTRVLFLVNPNNPTGTYVSDEHFRFLMAQVPSHVVVVVDEAYLEYIDKTDYPQIMQYLPHYPNLVVTRTFSKAYGLAGLRLGYAISSSDIADILNRARLPFNVNSVVASAGIAALKDSEHLQRTITLNKNVLAQLVNGIQLLGLSYIPSVGNFLCINVYDAVSTYEKLLRQGVIVRPLKSYNMPQYIRVSTGTEEQNRRFLEVLPHCLSVKRASYESSE